MLEAANIAKSNPVGTPQTNLSLDTVKIEHNRETVEKSKAEITEKAHKIDQTKQAKMERIAQAMDSYVQSIQKDIKIGVHNATGNIMITVISKEDGKVIREIPSREALNLAANMEEMMGILFNGKA